MKTTQKAIRAEIEAGRATDITTTRPEYPAAIHKAEHGFSAEAVGCGTYGLTGCIVTDNAKNRIVYTTLTHSCTGCVPFQYHKPPKSNANTTRQIICSVLY